MSDTTGQDAERQRSDDDPEVAQRLVEEARTEGLDLVGGRYVRRQPAGDRPRDKLVRRRRGSGPWAPVAEVAAAASTAPVEVRHPPQPDVRGLMVNAARWAAGTG